MLFFFLPFISFLFPTSFSCWFVAVILSSLLFCFFLLIGDFVAGLVLVLFLLVPSFVVVLCFFSSPSPFPSISLRFLLLLLLFFLFFNSSFNSSSLSSSSSPCSIVLVLVPGVVCGVSLVRGYSYPLFVVLVVLVVEIVCPSWVSKSFCCCCCLQNNAITKKY